MWKKQLLFSHVNFLSLSKISVVFNISSSHRNTNLPTRCFSQKQFLKTKYSSTLNALLHSKSHVLGFHIKLFSQEHQSSNSWKSHQHSLSFHFCFELHTLWFNLHSHQHDSYWTTNFVSFTLYMKLDIFTFIFFRLFEIQTRAYGSSIVLQFPPHLLILTING